jgi:FtsZ-binding cell division protein ZapB
MENDDRIKKQMEFMLAQQARFDANIGQLQERDAEIQRKHEQLQERDAEIQRKHEQLRNIVERLATVTLEGFENLEVKMSSLVDAQIRTEDNVSRLNEKTERTTQQLTEKTERATQRLTERMAALAEAQAQTDDRLKALINVVELHISEGRNGGPER